MAAHKEDKNLDDFREWLSDNLRYFMLGGVILIIVVVLFCGIRACSGSNKGNSGDEQKTTSEDQGNVPSSPWYITMASALMSNSWLICANG